MMKFKLYLYKFLGKFSNYFKRKGMHHSLTLINQVIISHLQRCPYYGVFTITSFTNVFNQRNNYYEVKYDVQYNAVTFNLILKYLNGVIQKESVSQTQSVNIADMKIIVNLCDCFEKIPEDSLIHGLTQLNEHLNTPLSN